MSLPPLKSLVAFEAVIRLGGVGRAALELGVSQPAVSQQMRVLEGYFGRRLIERTPKGFRVEPEVEVYAARIGRAVAEIHAASVAFQTQNRRIENQLTVALLATFAQRWLIPRLIDFQQKRPDIDVRLMTTSEMADLLKIEADISIRCGDGAWPGQTSAFLMANRIFPVASPSYLERRPLRDVRDLRQASLIRVDARPRDLDWPSWLDNVGAAALTPISWQSFANSTHALEAATAGLGVAMAHTPFVLDSIASGRLIKPFTQDFADIDGDYYLTTPKRRESPRRIRLFRDWLLTEAAAHR